MVAGVGFRTELLADGSRSYGDAARPVLAATWYPAAAPGAPMVYGDYVTVPGDGPHARRLSDYNRQITTQYGLGGSDDPVALAQRLALPMGATRDAPPAPGAFPAILYHPGLGGSYDDNALLCERLAARGFVVVSSAFSPADPASLHLDYDFDRSVADLNFLADRLAHHPSVDADRIGAVGHSFGAQAALAWSSEPDSPLHAVVSLDSTVEYAPDSPGFADLRRRLARTENLSAAWLTVAVGGESPQESVWSGLPQPIWCAETGPMEHDDFTAQAMLGRADPIVRVRYDAVCRLTGAFFAATLADGPPVDAFADPEIVVRSSRCGR